MKSQLRFCGQRLFCTGAPLQILIVVREDLIGTSHQPDLRAVISAHYFGGCPDRANPYLGIVRNVGRRWDERDLLAFKEHLNFFSVCCLVAIAWCGAWHHLRDRPPWGWVYARDSDVARQRQYGIRWDFRWCIRCIEVECGGGGLYGLGNHGCGGSGGRATQSARAWWASRGRGGDDEGWEAHETRAGR